MPASPAPAIDRIVIVGAGLAGVSAAEALRANGFVGSIMLIGADPNPPYDRPPLSKDVLLGKREANATGLHELDWYADKDIVLLTGAPVSAIDPAARTVRVSGREPIGYDFLLLASGSQPRHLADLDDSGARVHYLRTVDDAASLKADLGKRLLIVGGGWIGLEVAAAARQGGGTVTLIEAAAQPLANILGPKVATVFADLHREHGVDLRTGTTIAGVAVGDDGAATVTLSDGSLVVVDAIVVGIGASPDTDLAREAGLEVDNGVLVDATLRTSDPRIYAAGDIANQDHPSLGRLRVEHWDNARAQAKHAATTMLGGQQAYERQPYFSVTSTTSDSNTSGTAAAKTRSAPRAIWPDERSARGGSAMASSSPVCTSTTGTPPTGSVRSSAVRRQPWTEPPNRPRLRSASPSSEAQSTTARCTAGDRVPPASADWAASWT